MSQLKRATLSELLEQAIPYEQWRAPLDPRLQALTWLAGAALFVHLLFLFSLPWWLEMSRSGFFLVGGGILRGVFSWISVHTPWLLILNLMALAAFLWLVWHTRGLQVGRLTAHRLAFAEAAAGAASAFPLAVSLAMILLNLILWILVVVASVALLCFLLGAFFSKN
jgi:hypothetical protein